jgi:small subunit ribosomal protein S20
LAHSLSAIKRIRQNEERRQRNRANRSQLRTQIKKVRKALDDNDIEAARALLPETASLLDRLVKKGIIHGNTGSRYMSRLAHHVSASASS